MAEQQEARKVFKRRAEAVKRQTEACTLAVKRQKRQRYTNGGRQDAVKR